MGFNGKNTVVGYQLLLLTSHQITIVAPCLIHIMNLEDDETQHLPFFLDFIALPNAWTPELLRVSAYSVTTCSPFSLCAPLLNKKGLC